MKLLFTGSAFCTLPTLKRLLLVSSDIGFMDRPSVTFGSWGTVGMDSPVRGFPPTGAPVTISAYRPPHGPAQQLYLPYINSDLANQAFKRAFWEGFRQSDVFAEKFVQPGANYGSGLTGAAIRQALLEHEHELDAPGVDSEIDQPILFDVRSEAGRQATTKTMLVQASIYITSALVTAGEANAFPVSDDPFILRLLALRASDPGYIGGTSPLSPFLGVEFVKSVIPDEVLEELTVPDIFAYRKKSKDVYEAWTTEVNRVAATIEEVDLADIETVVPRLIATELTPKLTDLRNELASARDTLFGDLMKKAAEVEWWHLPTLSVAFVTGGLGAAAAAFAVVATPKLVPPVVDYANARRAAERRHAAVSYLVGATRG